MLLLLAAPLRPLWATEPTMDGFFIAPDGQDNWSGRLPVPNASGTDGPFATFSAAQAAMRGGAGRHVAYVREGAYFLDAPLHFGPADEGEEIAAYTGETPVIYGGLMVQGWSRIGADMFRAAVPLAVSLDSGLPLLIAGDRVLPIARDPPIGQGDDHESAWLFADRTPAGLDSHSSFRVRPANIDAVAAAPPGAVVTIFSQRGWQNYVLPIAHVDAPRFIVKLRGSTWDALGEASRFAVLNTVPTPGTWRFDPASSALLLRMTDPTAAPPAHGVVSILPCIVSMEQARGVTLSGLHLIGSATEGAAVCLSQTQQIALDGLVIAGTGDGIRLDHATGTRIANSEISQTGGQGIVLREGSDATAVVENWLHDIGWLHQDASAIWFDGSSHNRFVRNRIERVSKFGIGGGSLEGGGAYDNAIENNEIDGTNERTSDGGGIMVIGWAQESTGDVISGNIVSRTTALGNNGWDGKPHSTFQDPVTRLVSQAIYLDDWASGVQVSGNLICNNIGGIELHSGWDNQIDHNFFIRNSGIAISIDADNWLGDGARPHPMQNNNIDRNVVVLDWPGTGQSGILALHGTDSAAHFDNNLYVGMGLNEYSFHQTPDRFLSSYSFGIRAWRRRGQDVASVVGAGVAGVVLRDDAMSVIGAVQAPGPLLLGDVGRSKDNSGLADRLRQHCGVP